MHFFYSHIILFFFTSLISSAHPIHSLQAINSSSFPDVQELLEGNRQFRTEIEHDQPGLLKQLGTGEQHPPFMFLGCSDSRTSEGTIFHALPGKLFAERNIANQFHESDTNANAVLAYAIGHLGVQHIIVMGHYGCGGVSNAISSSYMPSDISDSIQRWILPIRKLYLSSNRTEIVALRERNRSLNPVPAPDVHDPGFRALVEENVKANVQRVYESNAVKPLSSHRISSNRRAPSSETYVHGWVYDMESGEVIDLGVSVRLGIA